jgi:hypothetical protein
MSSMVFGEIDWNSADSGSGGERASDFMKLSEGENTVRIMGNPVQFYIHWLETSSGKRKVNSPFEDAELVRRLEDSGFKRQARWLIKVLDRRDNNFKLLDVGPQIYNGIKALYNNARWGKVTQYDITIVKAPKGTQPLYGVTPNPKEAIPADLKDKFVAFNERVNLDKIIAPTESKEIYDMMGWRQAGASAGKTAAASSQSKASDSDFDFDFE